MDVLCDWCAEPALPGRPDPNSRLADGTPYVRLYCARCWERYEEQERRYDEVQAAGGIFNPSKDDAFYRDWLTSRELFFTWHDIAPRFCQRIGRVLGGEVFEFGRPGTSNISCWVQAWISADEVVVSYGDIMSEGELEILVDRVRNSEPLELGRGWFDGMRVWWGYGAVLPSGSHGLPIVKWGHWGDWCALARGWYWATKAGLIEEHQAVEDQSSCTTSIPTST